MFTPLDLVSLNRVQSLSVSPVDDWAAVVVDRREENGSKYESGLVRVDLKTGETQNLTQDKWNHTAPAFDREGRLYFLSNRATEDEDKKHDKRSQLWCFDGVGDPRQVTFEPLGVSSFKLSEDGLFLQTSALADTPHENQREAFDEKSEHGPSALRYKPPMRVRFWDHWRPNTETHVVVIRGEQRTVLLSDEIGEWIITPNGEIVFATLVRRSERRTPRYELVRIDTRSGNQRTLKNEDSFIANLAANDEILALVEEKITGHKTDHTPLEFFRPRDRSVFRFLRRLRRLSCPDRIRRNWSIASFGRSSRNQSGVSVPKRRARNTDRKRRNAFERQDLVWRLLWSSLSSRPPSGSFYSDRRRRDVFDKFERLRAV